MENQNSINFHSHDKVLVKCCVECYHKCWKRRCVALHNLEVQKKVLKEEALDIMEDASKQELKWLRRYVEVHRLNLNVVSVEQMSSWVRSAAVIKNRACTS